MIDLEVYVLKGQLLCSAMSSGSYCLEDGLLQWNKYKVHDTRSHKNAISEWNVKWAISNSCPKFVMLESVKCVRTEGRGAVERCQSFKLLTL